MKPPEDMIESSRWPAALLFPVHRGGGSVVEVPWELPGSPSKSYNLCHSNKPDKCSSLSSEQRDDPPDSALNQGGT